MGTLKQSLVYWCYQQYWTPREMCAVAKELGCASIEVIDPEHWPLLKEFGLTCALAGSHGFIRGLNNPAYHEECLTMLRQRIEQCAAFEFPNVITFTGSREDFPDDIGQHNCVRALREIADFAEEKGVTLCLEMLNSRVDVAMKGHPGYMGDHMDWCIEVIEKVGSPRVKVLFDIYHVQIMDGDVIARMRQYKDYIGHVHTAGVPGRFELHGKQEINYPVVMEALAELGYDGYVGQEFFLTRETREFALEALRKAVDICAV
jgi:hydroxypyruvate isomerase